jgi:hypothetical protein
MPGVFDIMSEIREFQTYAYIVFVSTWTEQKSALAWTGLQPERRKQGYRQHRCCSRGFLHLTACILDGVHIRPSGCPIKEFDIGLQQFSSFLDYTRIVKGRLYLLQLHYSIWIKQPTLQRPPLRSSSVLILNTDYMLFCMMDQITQMDRKPLRAEVDSCRGS